MRVPRGVACLLEGWRASEFFSNQEDRIDMITARIKAFAKAEQGATMIEYALVVGLIAIVCIGAVTIFGGNLSAAFDNLYNNLATATTASTPGK